MILSLLALQAAVTISATDRAAFEEYRQCVLTGAREAGPAMTPQRLIAEVEADCRMDRVAGMMEIIAAHRKATGAALSAVVAEQRMVVLEKELAGEIGKLWQEVALSAAKPGAAAEQQYEEVVIQGRFNFFTLVFDRLPSGKLDNCRIMVSSGNDRIDADACREVPVCVTAADAAQCDLATAGRVSGRRKLRGPAPKDLKLPIGR